MTQIAALHLVGSDHVNTAHQKQPHSLGKIQLNNFLHYLALSTTRKANQSSLRNGTAEPTRLVNFIPLTSPMAPASHSASFKASSSTPNRAQKKKSKKPVASRF